MVCFGRDSDLHTHGRDDDHSLCNRCFLRVLSTFAVVSRLVSLGYTELEPFASVSSP